MWVFGYGSLIWRPGFAYEERRWGYVEGWARRFYQGSADHRGVPEKPGRVVTLLPAEEARTWGVAYRLEGSAAAQVLEALDHREKGGYDRLGLEVRGEGGEWSLAEVLTYVATPQNPHFLGAAPVEEMARQIWEAEGPSGRNRDYVMRLWESLNQRGLSDEHVGELVEAMKQWGR